MAKDFDVDYGTMQIFISGYFLSLAFFQLIIGPVSDRIGRKPTMIAAFILFTASTLICEITTNFYVFLVFRMLQAGVAAGFVLGRAVIRDIVPMEHAASMIGYVTMAMTIMPMLAPALGGILEEQLNWRYSLRLMYLMGIISLLLIWFDQKETLNKNEISKAKLSEDYKELFLNKDFWFYVFVMGFSVGSYFSFLTGAPVISAEYFELAPSVQGYLFAILGFGFFLGNFLTGRFAMKIGPNRFMLWGCFFALTGPVIQTLIYLNFTFGPLSFFTPMFLVGLGQGLIVPNAAAGIVSVNPKSAGSASGLGATIQVMIGGILAYATGYIIADFVSPLPLSCILFFTIFVTLFFSFKLQKSSIV
jgi:DHA1 family bicyclomycin/chloramphenicol resistance-like MFS transporter